MNKAVDISLNIDFELLREQKSALVEASQGNDKLLGLVILLDYIQDEAIKAGVSEIEIYGEDDA